MRVSTLSYYDRTGWEAGEADVANPQLVIWFAAHALATTPSAFEALRKLYPNALIAGCSTNGEIHNGEALDGSCVAAAIEFKSTEVRAAYAVLEPNEDARAAGLRLAEDLAVGDLRAVYVLADAFGLNGANLVDGLTAGLPKGVELTGGMAGDGAGALTTLAGLNGPLQQRGVVVLGFYGSSVRVKNGVASGWDALGPARLVTRSEGATVYELDGQPALDVYERFVGDAETLSRLRHPFAFTPTADSQHDIIREVVGVDEARRGIVFVDAVPQGCWARFLRGDDERLIDGASLAAQRAGMKDVDDQALGLVVSCIGRKWVMGQRIGDETEAVQEEAANTPTIGFYSYGEVAPHDRTGECTLHHASVSITVLSEAA